MGRLILVYFYEHLLRYSTCWNVMCCTFYRHGLCSYTAFYHYDMIAYRMKISEEPLNKWIIYSGILKQLLTFFNNKCMIPSRKTHTKWWNFLPEQQRRPTRIANTFMIVVCFARAQLVLYMDTWKSQIHVFEIKRRAYIYGRLEKLKSRVWDKKT